MKLANILKEKKTSIIGFFLAASTMAKVMGWIPENVAGGLTAFIPETVNFVIVAILALSKDGK